MGISLEDLVCQADSHREAWRQLGLLLRALDGDPGLDAVRQACGIDGTHGVYIGADGNPHAKAATDALGRACRKVLASGGPDIDDPAGLLFLLSSFRCYDIPRFKLGRPNPARLRSVG